MTQNDLSSLEEMGSWRVGQADLSPSTINAGDGAPLSAGRQRRVNNPRYRQGLSEAFRLYERVLKGDRYAALRFVEAMSTSDFPLMFGDILDRQILGEYADIPTQWDRLSRRGQVRNFTAVKRYAVDGAESALPEVSELTEYPAAALTETPYEYRVTKRGRRIPMSWETWVNDDLGAFRNLPARLARAARRTEEKFSTSLFVSSTGPNSTFFAAGNNNIVTGNPALSITALQTAFTVLGAQVDSGGEPIYIETVNLVVPRALEVTARNILNATEIMAASGGGDGTGNDQLRSVNWMRDRVNLIVDPWMPIINTTNGNTAWYLFADPNVGRPAMEIGFLIGHETPELWQKAPNAMLVGGGMVAPEMGDFETDSLQWRVRHVVGGVLLDPKMAVASTG